MRYALAASREAVRGSCWVWVFEEEVENTVVKASLIRCVSSVMSSLCSGLVLVMMDELCVLCNVWVGIGMASDVCVFVLC